MYWTSALSACAGWPHQEILGRSLPAEQELTVPVLVLATEHDPVTPVEGAAQATRASVRGHLLVVNGAWGHGVVWRSSCADAALSEFVAAPGSDLRASCQPDHPLFP